MALKKWPRSLFIWYTEL